MDFSADIKNIHKVIRTSLIDNEIQQSLLQRLDFIERRMNDRNLYVGIVGEFSSGKSTLINALIGQDYFVTNSVQGTTTVITSIQYGKSINLELRYKNGEIIKYSNNKLALIEKFLPEDYSNLTFSDKLKTKTADVFSLNGKDEYMLKIFDLVTTSNEIAQVLDEVKVYYPSEFLKNGIVLIDTPGTDSLVEAHSEITRNAIAYKCDLALVIIPALTPVTKTLSDFISENLEHCLDRCHFLVTKIEMIRKREREEHLIGVKKRLIHMNEIENPDVIGAPTLLSLENRGIIEPTELLRHLKDDEKEELVASYNEEINNLINHLHRNKSYSKSMSISNLINNFLNDSLFELNEVLSSKEHKLSNKKANRTIALNEILGSLNRQDLSTVHEVTLKRIKSDFSTIKEKYEQELMADISAAVSKDEIQKTMKTEKCLAGGQAAFQECFEIMLQHTNWMIGYYEDAFNNLSRMFRNAYSIEPLPYAPDIDTKGLTIKNYKNSFSSSSLSTFFLKRMFIDKETIRKEMMEAVSAHLNSIFDSLFNYYSERIVKIDNKLGKYADKLIRQYNKKFDKIVKALISKDLVIEDIISNNIRYTANQIRELEDLKAGL